jgi:hypothetical protein
LIWSIRSFNRSWSFIFIGWRDLAPQGNPFTNLNLLGLLFRFGQGAPVRPVRCISHTGVLGVQILYKSYLPYPDSDLDLPHMNLDLLDENYPMVKSKLYFMVFDNNGPTGGTHRSDRWDKTCQFWVRTRWKIWLGHAPEIGHQPYLSRPNIGSRATFVSPPRHNGSAENWTENPNRQQWRHEQRRPVPCYESREPGTRLPGQLPGASGYPKRRWCARSKHRQLWSSHIMEVPRRPVEPCMNPYRHTYLCLMCCSLCFL